MSSRRLLTRWWMSSIVAVTASLSACATAAAPFVVALPNGYYLQRDKDSKVGLIKRGGGFVIRGPIAAYAVSSSIVAGCVGEWPKRAFGYPNESPYPDSPECRYFILDTKNAELEKDLEPAEWRSRLKAHGAPETLRITAPILPV